MNIWLNQKPFAVTPEITTQEFGLHRKPLTCRLCGAVFSVGDIARWVYANGTPGGCGNFFVCQKCDGDDVLQRAIADYQYTIRNAKRWGIIGGRE